MPEDQLPGMEEPEGDPVPAPSRRRSGGRRRKSSEAFSGNPPDEKGDVQEAVEDGAEQATAALADAKVSRRTSKEARAGGEVAWGLMGTGVQIGGQYSGTPGAVAAGWVMQAQAKEGGRVLAQKLLHSRYYPYLEKLGRGGNIGSVVVAPLCAFFYVQVPAVRPLVVPLLNGMIGSLVIPVPDPSGAVQEVNLWQAIQMETAAQEERGAERAAEEAAMAAAANGSGVPPHHEPGYVPPVDEPEPGVEHVRSVYNDLSDAPPEI